MIALLPILIITTILHLIATGIVWIILQELTKKFSFRSTAPSDKSGNRYPWMLSLILTLSFLLPCLMCSSDPDIDNYGITLSSFLFIAYASGLFSLGCWIRMIIKPELRTLHLAIVGMLSSGTGLVFLFFVGAASPV